MAFIEYVMELVDYVPELKLDAHCAPCDCPSAGLDGHAFRLLRIGSQ